MSNKQIAALAFRVLALYLFVIQLPGLLAFASSAFFDNEDAFIDLEIIQAAFHALSLILALLIWRFADALANRAISNEQTIATESGLTVHDLKSVAFAAIGVYVITHALPFLLSGILQYTIVDKELLPPAVSQDLIGQIFGNLLRSIIGVWLLLGSRGILGSINKLRSAGIKEPEATSPSDAGK